MGILEFFAKAKHLENEMHDQRKPYYRVFAPGVPNRRVVSEHLASEADAKRLKREILMAYPAATVRIEKTDESGRRSS